MRWEDERYVRIFTRDTPSWDAMGWEAQALLMLIFRKMDRTGLLALGNSGRRGLAACVRMPLDVVERALDVLLEDGVLTMSGKDIFCPNFMAAQECAKSDALRSREKRERAHLGLTQSVSRETRAVAQTPRSDTSAPRSDTPSVPSDPVPSDPNQTILSTHGGQLELTPPAEVFDSQSDAIRKVFAHYRTHHPRACPSPAPTSKEWRKIRDRLGEGSTVDDLCKAIDGYHRHAWHVENGQLGLELIVRDASHVAQGIGWANGSGNGQSLGRHGHARAEDSKFTQTGKVDL